MSFPAEESSEEEDEESEEDSEEEEEEEEEEGTATEKSVWTEQKSWDFFKKCLMQFLEWKVS